MPHPAAHATSLGWRLAPPPRSTEFARLGGHRCELGWRLAPPNTFDCSVRGCGGTQSHAVPSLYRPVGGGKWPAEGWIAQSLARDQSDDDVDDVDDGDEDVGDDDDDVSGADG